MGSMAESFLGSAARAGLICIAAFTAGASFAQEAPLPEKYKTAGVVRVGIQNQYPPFNYIDPKTKDVIGLNVDLFAALAEKMGVRMEIVIASFPDLFPGLASDRFDLIGAGITDNATRRETLTFADYLKSGPVVMTSAAKADQFKSLDDLCGHSSAHVRFVALFGQVLKGLSDQTCVANGKPPIDVVTDDLPVQLGLAQDRYETAMVAQELFLYLRSTEPDSYVQIGEVVMPSLFGIAFRKEDTDLRNAIGAGIQALIDDGTYRKILDKYGLADMALDKVVYDAGPN